MTLPAEQRPHTVIIKKMGIDTYQEPVIYMSADCHVCKSEGFESHSRIRVTKGKRSIIATLNVVTSGLLTDVQAGLSNVAWCLLGASEGDRATLSHPQPLNSLSYVRAKVYGHRLRGDQLDAIVHDIAKGRYADVHTASFLTACANGHLDEDEIVSLTRSMINVGDHIRWDRSPVVDKHCVGGLPGNRTTPIIVSIVTALGHVMPKTSSRAITSPAGTADTMETPAPVELDEKAIRRVVGSEGGCIVWGGALRLSPSDDMLIRVERALDLDSEGQLVASILSKKVAAGSTHVLVDIPVGPTAKVRNPKTAQTLSRRLAKVGQAVGLTVRPRITDGRQPVGRGIGPALEARDVLAVLQGHTGAPRDLQERSVILAAEVLEMTGSYREGDGTRLAQQCLEDGRAWDKFQAICEAQGGMRRPPVADHRRSVKATTSGQVANLDSRRLSRTAKLAGAPRAAAASIELHVTLDDTVEVGDSLFTLHAEAPGELGYAMDYAAENHDMIQIMEPR